MEEISSELKDYRKKWKQYFYLKGWNWDDDLLYETILKCQETISRLGLKSGKDQSFNYLFKALQMNYKRELEYARNKNREHVEDINILYETYMSNEPTADYKIVKDLWTEYQFNYILKEVELNWDKNGFYLFKLKYVLQLEDSDILKKTKNPDWKKDLRKIVKWLKVSIKKEQIKKDFELEYRDIDLTIIGE